MSSCTGTADRRIAPDEISPIINCLPIPAVIKPIPRCDKQINHANHRKMAHFFPLAITGGYRPFIGDGKSKGFVFSPHMGTVTKRKAA